MHGGYFAHGFTYSGHPVACAAGLANLDIIENDGLVTRTAADVGPYFQEKLRAFAGHPAVGEVRGLNLIGALELVPRGGRTALTPTMMLGVKATALAREQGVIVRGIRDIVAIAPPLTISHAEIDELFDAVRVAVDRVWD
jgi:putrescine aminotransferase